MNALNEIRAALQPSGDPDPSRLLERKEAVDQILSLLETLPENQQEVIRLKFQHGFSYREISGITKLSVSNVGFLIHTGLKTIRHQLAAQRILTRKPEGGSHER